MYWTNSLLFTALVSLLGWTGQLQAQSVDLLLLDSLYSIPTGTDDAFFTTDHLGGIYVVERDEITKYQFRRGKQERVKFSDPRYGDIAHIDAFNPLAVLLLYKPFNQILLIDNRLNPTTGAIRPEDIGIMDVQLISVTDNNRIWIYDQSSDRLVRFNIQSKQIEFQSQILTKLVGQEMSPNYMVSDMNGVYINAPETGLIIFDVFGNFEKKIPVKGLTNFQIKDRRLIYAKDGKVVMQSLRDASYSEKILPEPRSIIKVRVEDDKLYLQLEKGILVVKNPFLN